MTTGTLDGAAAPQPAKAGSSTAALLLLSLSILSAFTIMGVFSPLQDAAKAELGLSDLQLSLVQGVAASIPVALLAVPVGRLTDRGVRVWLLVAMAVIWSVGSIATAFAPDFVSLFAARMLAGVGAMCVMPVAISLSADLAPPERRGRSLLLLSLGKIIGSAAAFALGGWLFGVLGAAETRPLGLEPWRGVQLILGVAGLVLALPLLLMKEPERREVTQSIAGTGAALKAVWARRGFLAPLFIGQIGVVMADVSAMVWASPVLTRNYAQTPEQFAGWMGLVLLLSGLVGSVIGGFASDMGHKSRMAGGLLVGAVAMSVIAVPMALFPIMPGIPAFAVLFGVLLLAGSACGLITATALAVHVPNEIRGVCLSAFIVLASIIGFGAGPTLVTLISQAMGGETKLALALAVTGVVINVLSAAGFIAAMLQMRRR